jgi:23S rRNA (cytidine1920-2'-O)/16S rRNA (cytidine1409-2'-O)-methyltransferase
VSRRRLDVTLAERGLFGSREQARAAVIAGEVRVNGDVVTKAGHAVADGDSLEVAERPRYVSRGGVKLAGALDTFGLDVDGWSAVDVGASTGGFTDCLLQRGAAHVVAVDVGYGQLAWSLRTDDRVTAVERTNIRHVDPVELGAPFDLVVADLSFISIAKVLPSLTALMSPEAQLVVLVKPQFEAGKGRVGKKGVVKDPRIHAEVLRDAIGAMNAAGLVVRNVTYSPIAGPEGNLEFWVHAARSGPCADFDIAEVVSAAHRELGG